MRAVDLRRPGCQHTVKHFAAGKMLISLLCKLMSAYLPMGFKRHSKPKKQEPLLAEVGFTDASDAELCWCSQRLHAAGQVELSAGGLRAPECFTSRILIFNINIKSQYKTKTNE